MSKDKKGSQSAGNVEVDLDDLLMNLSSSLVFVAPVKVDPMAKFNVKGKTVVFTGTLTRWTRPEAEALAAKMGMIPKKSVVIGTNFVVAGPGAGAKLRKAARKDLEILDEDEFCALLKKNGVDF